MSFKVIEFTRKGERSHLTFSGFPEDDGSFVLTIDASKDGTDVDLGSRIPDEDRLNYAPIIGFKFSQKDSVVVMKKACEDIIKWFEKQEQEDTDEG